MPSPNMTLAAGTALASQSLAASATVTFTLDFSAKFEGQVQCGNLGGGTVAATSGLQVDIFAGTQGGPTYDTISATSVIVPTTVSTQKYITLKLPTGKYQGKFTNLDATNAITVQALYATIDSIS